MEKKNLPIHIAIIPDGNRRWARKRSLPTLEGHRRGFDRAYELVKKARDMGIKIVTLWAFSTENWKRTNEEVGYLMHLYELMIGKHVKDAQENNTRLIHIGRKDRIPSKLLKKIMEAEKITENNKKYFLCIGIDYGGEDEILRAVGKMVKLSNVVDHDSLFSCLDTATLPQQYVDLMIRTSGELRMSGFLPLQSTYAEFAFSEKMFPDFTPEDFEKSIADYILRKRRFGK
ncbi:di-trans,poly-cis-decaprenylcistransferase [Candidatus Roizmanbacteria bacterium CG17_big_fil_post_rev_8_21_14_2_50_39_7]|uniref:Isoprenyl transferase n=2 Tax=Candidatus Roizmaniibacteriota TaxID=1752723 RepID=A0A2M7EJ05_9BACT|nr:MAG: di-trans,poly-cis-decaprenylcistransferase [Candidatus Roizmanbacteria bacterium CG03_land_8_20_14_0_80_39_12]PIV70551.1 MAG: di-trans,poly-cis-decaprenylcistransferase [Candidatus Roizmanbacteria bacterium CG17_big_fil_post_rev_8_21_14_2_50_39_7]